MRSKRPTEELWIYILWYNERKLQSLLYPKNTANRTPLQIPVVSDRVKIFLRALTTQAVVGSLILLFLVIPQDYM